MRAVREHDGYFLVCCIYIFKWTTYKDHEGRLLPTVPEYTIQAFLTKIFVHHYLLSGITG